MSSNPVISTDNLTKIYRLGVRRHPVEALTGLNLDVFEGEVFAFIGLNGAGKTTTIKLLLDHARPSAGQAKILNIDTRNPKARQLVGYLPDMPYFHRFLTASELLAYTGRLFGLSRTVCKYKSQELLKLTGLEGRENEPLKGFSRGMLQRVGLAQALVNDPQVIILDEPLGGLDPIGRFEIRQTITRLKNEGKTIFFSSHILEDAQKTADRIGIIHKGKLLATGTLEELLADRKSWEIEIEISNELDLERWTSAKGIDMDVNGTRAVLHIQLDEDLKTVYRWAAESRLTILSAGLKRISLEEAFLKELGRWEG